jgi:tetratricopeptide (TPR) repeat protein
VPSAIRLQVVCLLAAASAHPAEHWIKLSSPHFLLYTTNGREKALDALRTFEEAHDFFAANSSSKPVSDDCVEIVAFSSEKQDSPYRINQGAFAYYQRGHKCDYIVMQQLGREALPAAIHEYTHLFVEHLGLRLPLWLNEGLADVYSSLQPRGDKLMIGTPPQGRLDALRALGPLDIRVLLNVTRESDYYNKPQAMAQFYAESWELTHMLLLGRKYHAGFSRFVAEIADGKSAEDAFAGVYQKTIAQVNLDLESYLTMGEIAVSLFDVHLDEKQLRPEITEPSDGEVRLLLADILSTHPQTAEAARARLMELASEMPKNPDVQESLAYAAWQEHKLDEARLRFENALKDGAQSAKMLFSYASVLHEMQAPPAQIVAVLQQAVQLKPDFYDARYDLGLEAARANDCGAAIAAFQGIKTVTPERAFSLFSTQAYCYWRLGDASRARRFAQSAQQNAKTPDETRRMQDFLDQLNRISPP